MNELGWAEMPPPPEPKRPSDVPPGWVSTVPHIYFKNGWWRVTRCNSRRISVIQLFNKAHNHVARLNGPPITFYPRQDST